jgi:probable rRNA maturation factor
VAVVVVNEQRRRVNRRELARVARAVMAAEGCVRGAELSVAIGDDEWIRKLNRDYRKKDAPTDVLAFPQEEAAAGGRPVLLGDVAISAETAARQAEEAGHSLQEELAVLLAHGILHLTGWGDETPAERRRMMRRVRNLLGQAAASGRA